MTSSMISFSIIGQSLAPLLLNVFLRVGESHGLFNDGRNVDWI